MSSLKSMLKAGKPILAPLAFNPISAKLAEDTGMDALYLGGGALGYLKLGTEANVNLVEMAHLGLEIRAKSKLPVILDGQCGWGDAMHVSHAIQVAEAAGFSAIEIEDQVVPKRAHHHVGVEHLVPTAEMVEKIRTAVASRRSSDFLIIARTNAMRNEGIDKAADRCEAYRKAGADMLFVVPSKPSDIRAIAERIGGPLMFMAVGAQPSGGLTIDEMYKLGYRIFVDSMSPMMSAYAALAENYRQIRQHADQSSIYVLPDMGGLQKRIHDTMELDRLLEIERQSVEPEADAKLARPHWSEPDK
jgi:2-methylisocitrate lyase-like PEP mutase family enzyme